MRISKVLIAFCLCMPSVALANVIELGALKPVPDESLAEMRGGFQLTDDYVINIGLSITTTINGQDILNTTIANLVIENGSLTNISGSNNPNGGGALDQGIVNIIQFGEGNFIGDNTPDMPSSNQPNIISSDFINSSIINIIQNTTDNSVIGLSTLVDIDAQVSGVMQQIRANQQLEDALLNHLQ
ncbi:hypothetical protein [Vibrio owensii]|uniref:hypothetical protein n=1 Tax=Vibrio owensii TaxID=696485 RepID=UPI00215C46CC|nr:hypothetical protein [Vibrio owensii]MCR9944600.1 hypothetical protein [Vibrio owensii]